MKKRVLNYLLAWVCVVLFCWVVFPTKWAKKIVFKVKYRRAIKKAAERRKTTKKRVFVVQNEREFYVGTREELRAMDKRIKRRLQRQGKSWLRWDYRNAIIYTAK